MFIESFKYYKSKEKPPKYDEVIDFNEQNLNSDIVITISIPKSTTQESFLGLKQTSTWNVFTIPSNPGLVFIRNPFTSQGQRYWISRCLKDYPKHPHQVNLKNIKTIPPEAITNWWQCLQTNRDNKNEFKKLKSAMRWATLGYHHDWDSKIYSEEHKHRFPSDLAELCAYFANALGFGKYSAEAAIVNYYPIGTTLAGHTDHSEKNLDAPLFSFSFGQTAIFLIGGKTKDIKPTAIFIKSGDVVIMSKESRLCYHAVPRILQTKYQSWDISQNFESQNVSTDIVEINETKKRKLNSENENFMTMDLWKDVEDPLKWKDFQDYVKDCRININVRQVLKNGETSL